MADRTKAIAAIVLLGVAIVAIVAFVGATSTFFKAPATAPAVPTDNTRQQLDYFSEIAFTTTG